MKDSANPTSMRIIYGDSPAYTEYDGFALLLDSIETDEIPTYRMLDCEEYDSCLTHAGKKDWISWTCYDCPLACRDAMNIPPANGFINSEKDESRWAQVPGHPAIFVSTEGLVRSTKSSHEAWRVAWPQSVSASSGEVYRLHSDDGKERHRCLSEIILATFCREKKSNEVAVHKNGDVLDCRLDNLSWGKQ